MPGRQCPYCDQPTDREQCEVHAVPTVESDLFERPPEAIREGALIAGRYRVERFLAEGGFGAVWVARQMAMNRTVALKLLRRAERRGPESLKRFYREALLISRLAHPNIIQIFDFGVDQASRVPFIVFELLEGRTLTDVVAKHGALPERRAVSIMAQVARALVEAHAQGVVHRDLKPNNVMVTKLRDGSRHVKVLDFGLAKIQEDGNDALTGITAPGSLVGAPHFMSPEQAAGARVDFRSDLYSFGCLLHALLAARPPFHSAQAADLIAAHLKQPPPPLPALIAGSPPSEALVVLHRSLLAKNPLERPPSADVVAKILNALADGDQVDARMVLERARKQAFSGAIPNADSLASHDALTAIADPTAPVQVPAILDDASTAPPVAASSKRANTAARRRIADEMTVPPLISEPLAPLSLSAATLAPVRTRRSLAVAFAAGALVVGIGGGWMLALRSEREPVAAAPPPEVAPSPPPPPPVAPEIRATERRIKVVVDPPAEVWIGGVRAGVTPMEIAPDVGAIELRAEGHRSMELPIDPERTEIAVALQKVKRPPRAVKRVRARPEEEAPAAKRKYPVW